VSGVFHLPPCFFTSVAISDVLSDRRGIACVLFPLLLPAACFHCSLLHTNISLSTSVRKEEEKGESKQRRKRGTKLEGGEFAFFRLRQSVSFFPPPPLLLFDVGRFTRDQNDETACLLFHARSVCRTVARSVTDNLSKSVEQQEAGQERQITRCQTVEVHTHTDRQTEASGSGRMAKAEQHNLHTWSQSNRGKEEDLTSGLYQKGRTETAVRGRKEEMKEGKTADLRTH